MPESPADTIRRAAESLRKGTKSHFRIAIADWLDAELSVHQQAGALAASAASGDLHVMGEPLRFEVGLSTFDKALAVARTWLEATDA